MSLDYTQLDQETLDLYEENFKELLKSIYGSDLDLNYADDGTVDLKVIGGDFNLTGTAIGNNMDDFMKMVKNRLHTRLMTSFSESPLLPNGYGSFLTDLIGISTTPDEGISSNENIINRNDLTGFITGIIKYALEFEPLVTEVVDIDVDYDTPFVIGITIRFKSVFLNQMSVTLELKGD